MDSLFRVQVISQTLKPQKVAYAAMHQDYSHDFVFDHYEDFPTEQRCGELVVKHLLKGDRGHYGPLEHPQIVLNFGYFPHSTMQQARTHRNVSFDVQSFRYTSKAILECANGDRPVESVFYLRPEGEYLDRNGGKYHYTRWQRQEDIAFCLRAAIVYASKLKDGMPEEQARGCIPFDVRQHWVMSGNARAIMHLLDIRGKYDVQLETRQMTEMLFDCFKAWMPEVAEWYEATRWRKGKLAP